MVTLPISIFFFIYLALVAVLTVFFAVNFFHIVLTGTTTLSSFLATLFVIAAIALILFGTWYFLQSVDWSQTITVWDNSWFGQSFNNTF